MSDYLGIEIHSPTRHLRRRVRDRRNLGEMKAAFVGSSPTIGPRDEADPSEYSIFLGSWMDLVNLGGVEKSHHRSPKETSARSSG